RGAVAGGRGWSGAFAAGAGAGGDAAGDSGRGIRGGRDAAQGTWLWAGRRRDRDGVWARRLWRLGGVWRSAASGGGGRDAEQVFGQRSGGDGGEGIAERVGNRLRSNKE